MIGIKKRVARAFRRFNIVVTKAHTFDRLIQSERELRRLTAGWSFLRNLSPGYLHRALELLPSSHGENFQDLFVALLLDNRENGYFVEFGATDGVTGSNTLLFERHAGWSGILAEPARIWHQMLAKNRKCIVAHECVWRASGDQVEFRQAADPGLSTMNRFANSDSHASKRRQSTIYSVPTITLNDLLARHGAPSRIDFLSIDTEGSELDILTAFAFNRYEVSVLIVEHNFREQREAIHALLTGHGFVRVLTAISKFDDWYVQRDFFPRVSEMFPSEVIESG